MRPLHACPLWAACLATAALRAGALLVGSAAEPGARTASSDPAGEYVDCSWPVRRNKKGHKGPPNGWPCAQPPDFARGNSRKTIVCIGDSITRGALVEMDESYPSNLYRLLHEEYNVLNLGVGGIGVQDKGRHSYWSLPHLGIALGSGFDVAIVQLGTNDAKTHSWDRAGYKRDYVRMLRELRQRRPKAAIIASIPPPAGNNSIEVEPGIVNRELAGAIKEAMAEAGLEPRLIDMQEAFGAVERPNARTGRPAGGLVGDDNVHPSPAGHLVMAEAAAAAVRRALR